MFGEIYIICFPDHDCDGEPAEENTADGRFNNWSQWHFHARLSSRWFCQPWRLQSLRLPLCSWLELPAFEQSPPPPLCEKKTFTLNRDFKQWQCSQVARVNGGMWKIARLTPVYLWFWACCRAAWQTGQQRSERALNHKKTTKLQNLSFV